MTDPQRRDEDPTEVLPFRIGSEDSEPFHQSLPPDDALAEAWGPAAHLLPLVSHWVGPLVLLLTIGRHDEQVRREATASLNWEITVAIVLALCGLAALASSNARGFALVSVGLVVAVSFTLHIVAALRVARGRSFSYPALPIVR